MLPIEAPKTITVDEKEYPVANFPEVVQRLVIIRTAWQNDLQKERLALTKTEAAVRAVDAELTQAVNAALNPSAPADTTNSTGDTNSITGVGSNSVTGTG